MFRVDRTPKLFAFRWARLVCPRLVCPRLVACGKIFAMLVPLFVGTASAVAGELLIEAESFEQPGGWVLDTQFVRSMGSPYLLAHGLGRPVKDATTTVTFPEAGKYQVFVRTFDWVARWNADGSPGKFQLLVNGQPLKQILGTEGKDWNWQPAGTVEISEPAKVRLALHDLTGFDGRMDAVYFTTGSAAGAGKGLPPSGQAELASWRRMKLGLPEQPETRGPYDLVVVGGGYSGMGAALAAARMGCKVALIQDRGVLGGNGSSEVRVWAQGLIRRGKFSRIGEIIDEFCDHATSSPGLADEFGDEKKEALVHAEKNIDLFLNNHVDKVELVGDAKSNPGTGASQRAGASQRTGAAQGTGIEDRRLPSAIAAVEAFNTRTSRRTRFAGTLFVDATGHGTIGFLAGADWEMTPEGRMGMSNMWRWEQTEAPQAFPSTPWALDLAMRDFPYPKRFHGEWFWESGFDKDPLEGAEAIRDWNLRAVYGAFDAMKNGEGAAAHKNAQLTWIAYVGGPRESRRLMGDVVLTQDDIVSKREFADGCVPSTWSIDLHYPKEEYARKFPDNPFISIAVHDQRIDRQYGYPVPYRCFYSRNVPNLFMAGRNISVTHEALGTTRVMKTCGMMGEVIGKAASVCIAKNCQPRDVANSYLEDLFDLLRLPGKAHRDTPTSKVTIPDDALPQAGAYGPATGLDPLKLDGLVVDDRRAQKSAGWTEGTGLKGYVGYGYLYAGGGGNSTITFSARAPATGMYEVRFAYQPHENRATNAKAIVVTDTERKAVPLNLQSPPPIAGGWVSLGQYQVEKKRAAVGRTVGSGSQWPPACRCDSTVAGLRKIAARRDRHHSQLFLGTGSRTAPCSHLLSGLGLSKASCVQRLRALKGFVR